MARAFHIIPALVLAALLAGPSQAGTVVFGPGDDQVYDWLQSPDAVTLSGTGFLGTRFVRLDDGGSIATLLTAAALENAMYGMTAAFARFAPESQWTLEVFAGGEMTLGDGVPAGAKLLISNAGGVPNTSTEDNPAWVARGTGDSPLSVSPPAGSVIWMRVRASGGALGVDSVLGVENVTGVWYPGSTPSTQQITNWDFENDPPFADTPEPSTLALMGAGLFVMGLGRNRWRKSQIQPRAR
jgi:hypothetical protein